MITKIKKGLKWAFETFLKTRRRKLTGKYLTITKIFGFSMAAFYVYTGAFGIVSPESHRAVIFTVTLVLSFMLLPGGKKSPLNRFTWWDTFLIVISILMGAYFITNFPQFIYRAGDYTTTDAIMGWIGILLSLEAARRGTGTPIPILAMLILLYASTWVGPNLPGMWAHKGYDFYRIGSFLFTTYEGLLGTVAYTVATYIMPFVIFGSFMAATGVGRWFIQMPYALFGDVVGGAAIVSVFAGLLMGMLAGSPVANVLAIGAFLLPLMAKAGYDPETAGGVVSSASSGAMITPPVMGSAAFFMVELTGISYIEIIKMAFFPALLYYLGMLVQVKLHAKKVGLAPVPKAELPDWRKVLKEGWYFSIPLMVLVIFLMLDYSPGRCALWAALTCILVSLPRKETRMSLKKFFDAMATASMDIMIIGCIAGAIGVIIGIIGLSGLGAKFTEILLAVGGGQLLPTVIMVAVAAIILGMGAPIGAVYLILAVLVPPALRELGVSVAAAHMIIMWFSQLSGLTPPVCLVAYAAAAMNDGEPFKTGFNSLKYGSLLVIVPLMFIYTDILNVGSSQWYIDLFTGIMGVFFWAAFIQGYWLRKNNLMESILFGGGALMLFAPAGMINIIGIAICLGLWAIQFLTLRRKRWGSVGS